MQLSKSEYMMYLKHPAWLWLKKHDKAKLPEVDANLQAMFDAGHDFETYAEQLFEDGSRLGWNSFDEYKTLPQKTMNALHGKVPTLFQGRIETADTTFIFDILNRVEGNRFDLYEIKSSTKVKPEHYDDLAFQLYVAAQAGIDIRNVYVVHVNSNYVRHGDIDPRDITVTEDVSDEVRNKQQEAERQINNALHVMKQPTMPDPSPRYASSDGFRDWLEIYRNLYDIPDNSIYNLAGLDPQLCAQLEDAGIATIDAIGNGFKLKPRQSWQVRAFSQAEPIIKIDKIESFLESLEFPLYFLDYETLGDVVPPFDGLRPYQQLPFQYSLHVLPGPDSQFEHYEYLHTDSSHPVRPLAEQLLSEVGASGSVLVWSKSFEQGCNELMGELEPRFRSGLEALNRRIVDLMDPFAYGWYVDYRFGGSASIKNVLPVLAPDLSYKELEIQEGGSAQRLWMDAVLHDNQTGGDEQLLENLRAYCRLDTWAMVRIYQHLENPELAAGSASNQQASLF